ncbi:folate family ECF transporter S component [Limosilactobacillus fastidiosus]|uniref:Folate family ECF transporter S component n=1 Tax=Limosilactobacillus fastidiosus TaxID=2759855 RepID=A0A7W3YC56_9LACO|nr:folate family ECF transporter S component [Limosilactobacillus fastidiosus]MBB1062412.1 folate family ECF transporter S component [Limosilactobacillus fastidiosus]MBB1085637.1 folate family ECF transporter S component [Limosilactobacillus fastidiosus]MCD7083487.1 folate family ECF transporter S component [Limosilactobacillus fastidiosus]MCD7086090.1 folate family ECF transporter S component [Limosilactobacillus fastidiosus]MCD7114266.1 folate family ECF transporter S component [Limosilactob
MSSILSFAGPRFTTKRLTLAGMLIALEVILDKISIGNPTILKFGFGFIATALIGYYLGPWIGGWSMVVNDIISNTILNSGTAFFPGFTFSAFVSGVLAGMFLYNQKVTWQRALVYEFFQTLITNVIFTTFWIYIMSLNSGSNGRTFWALLLIRLPKEVITWPLEGIIVFFILRRLSQIYSSTNIS